MKSAKKLEIYQDFPFKQALSSEDISIIAEVKRASPSKGLIAEDFDYVAIAKEYEDAGVSAISVLTEPYFFKGSNDYLKEISKNVNVPLLIKRAENMGVRVITKEQVETNLGQALLDIAKS